MQSDLIEIKIFNIDALSQEEKQILLSLFNTLRDVEFPSIFRTIRKSFLGKSRIR